ncbi:MAG TPA: hypothetical protein VIZ60_03985 [Rubrobacter sp.]|jgi:hypothetical protein
MDKSDRESWTLTCPFCAEAELCGFGRNSLRCDECGDVLGGAYRCPACGSEVTPITAPVSWKSPEHTEAYWSGWLDGRYGDPKKFTHNRRLAKWDGAADRLDYYRGHRAGYEARLKKVTLVEAS